MYEWEQNIRKVEPYVPGEQPTGRVVKLNTNENPYPPSPKVLEALAALDLENAKKYPDPSAGDLVRAIANAYGKREEEVFVGVGSDDVLGMAFLTFFNSDKPILFPDISYSFYDVWAELFQIPYEQIPLDEEFQIRIDDYRRPNGGIVIANPNAPTSIAMSKNVLEELIAANRESIVIVDEAYVDFGGESVLELTEKYENLVVVQTFSKSRSLAGMRIGFAIANERLISALQAVKYSYNSYTMNMPSIAAGKASVEDAEYFRSSIEQIMQTREKFAARLREIGFSMPDSSTNFLFATHSSIPAEKIYMALRERSIYVRYFKKPRIDNYLRITIGTEEEMESLLGALSEIVREQ